MHRSNTFLKSTTAMSTVFMVVAGLSTASNAQTTAKPAQTAADPEALEELVITGSRVVRDGYDAPTPVTVIGVEAFENTAASNLADAINQLPAVANSSTPTSTAQTVSAGTGGINGLNLRGLGVTRTLVLLNGQRTVGSILTGAVDASELPQSLVERVDVVTGGASAAYGSDALTGVVNFVLDTDYTGVKGEVSGGMTNYRDTANYKASLTAGTSFAGGRGHLLVSGEFHHNEGLMTYDRPWNRNGYMYINNPAYTPNSGLPAILATQSVSIGNASPGGTILLGPLKGVSFGPAGSIYQITYGDIVTPGAVLMRGGSWKALEIGPNIGLAAVPREYRQNAFTRVSYDVSDNVQVYAQASWGHLDSYSQGLPLQTGYFGTNGLTIRVDNAFIPESIRPALVAAGTTFNLGTTNPDLDNTRPIFDRRVVRALVGAEGSFTAADIDWTWDAYLGTGTSISKQDGLSLHRQRYLDAVDSVRLPNGRVVCRTTRDVNPNNGCVPYNVFGAGVNGPAAIEYVQGDYPIGRQRLDQKNAAVNFAGEPFSSWAGPVSLAFGYEYRKESGALRNEKDPTNSQYVFGVGSPYSGSFTNHDVYAETVVPLAVDESWARALDLNGAVRYTHYSNYGNTVTYKVGVSYSPIDDLRLRVTQSRNIRSPTIQDLYNTGTTTNVSLNDPETNTSVPYQSTTRGNPNLGPEKSNDLGIGVVLQPGWLPGFSTSLDYYRIRVNGAVGSIGAQQLVNLCHAGLTFTCASFSRVKNAAGQTVQIIAFLQPLNFATETIKGLDFEASYRTDLSTFFDSAEGAIAMRALVTHIISNTSYTGFPGDVPIESAGYVAGGVPSWRVNAKIDYSLDPVRVGLGFRWTPRQYNFTQWIECTTGCPNAVGSAQTTDNNTVDAALFMDFNAAYTINFGEDSTAELFLNVQNITNRDPPIARKGPGSNPFNYAPAIQGATYDLLGRVYRAGVRFQM